MSETPRSSPSRRKFAATTPFNERINKEHKDLLKQVDILTREQQEIIRVCREMYNEMRTEIATILKGLDELQKEFRKLRPEFNKLRQEFNQHHVYYRAHKNMTRQAIKAIHAVLESQASVCIDGRNTIARVYGPTMD